MPTLYEVCVWEIPFPSDTIGNYYGVDLEFDDLVDTTGSPNVYFTTECSTRTEATEYVQTEVSIYSNPANTYLTIEATLTDIITVEITALNGQLIYSREMEGPTTHQIDLSSFQKGIYLIIIRSEDFVTTEKIIKLGGNVK